MALTTARTSALRIEPVAGALGAAKVLERAVTGIQSMEPLAFVATVCLLVTAALLASFVPARRASRIDPVVAPKQAYTVIKSLVQQDAFIMASNKQSSAEFSITSTSPT